LLLLKPLGFVLATGLHPLLLKTAAHFFKCLRIRLALNQPNVPYARTVVEKRMLAFLFFFIFLKKEKPNINIQSRSL
jgi:hypothetical protein